jgi:4-hydroxymandelate oxidase
VKFGRAVTLADVERAARRKLSRPTWAYLAGGAGSERSVDANVRALAAVWLRPRPFTAVTEADASVKIFDQTLSMPVLLAPTSPQRLFHKDAEQATAKAASAAGTVAVVSSDSHYPFAAVSAASQGCCWFQLYAYQSLRTVQATMEMAEEAGAKAIVLTVDADHPARRVTLWRSGFSAPRGLDFGTLRALGILDGPVPADARLPRLCLDWKDLPWIRRHTSAPLLIKGVLDPGDARRCIDLGADGVIVSNHGGRQLDGVLPSVLALPEIAAAIGPRAAILVDGGIRSGIDVIKTLALGAHAVCIGRPYLWGLALDGERGVRAVLALLRAEVVDAMLQLGVSNVGELDERHLAEVRWEVRWSEHRPARARARAP